jgi:hypothetical protein
MAEEKNMAAHWGQIAVMRSGCMELLAVLARRRLLPEENVRLAELSFRAGCVEEVSALERSIIKLRADIEQLESELKTYERKETRRAMPDLFRTPGSVLP